MTSHKKYHKACFCSNLLYLKTSCRVYYLGNFMPGFHDMPWNARRVPVEPCCHCKVLPTCAASSWMKQLGSRIWLASPSRRGNWGRLDLTWMHGDNQGKWSWIPWSLVMKGWWWVTSPFTWPWQWKCFFYRICQSSSIMIMPGKST